MLFETSALYVSVCLNSGKSGILNSGGYCFLIYSLPPPFPSRPVNSSFPTTPPLSNVGP
jgi:hypothetical protein